MPIGVEVEFLPPEQIKEITSYIQKHRTSDAPFDVCLLGLTPGKDLAADKAVVAPYIPAGLTWWLEAFNTRRGSINQVTERIRIGPPR